MRLPIALVLLVACSSEGSPPAPTDMSPQRPKPSAGTDKTSQPAAVQTGDAPTDDADEMAIGSSRRPNLQWKRYRALEAELARGLELDPGELCSEFGGDSCIRSVHLVPLGGHEPFTSGMLEPSAEPLATTPTVVDRVMLSACGRRAQLDGELGPGGAKLLGALAVDTPAPAPDDDSVKSYVTQLYQRLLARDPEAFELSAVASLARNGEGQALPALEFATLACFAVASSSEFLFF